MVRFKKQCERCNEFNISKQKQSINHNGGVKFHSEKTKIKMKN